MDHDRDDEALTVLAKLHANGDKSDPMVISEYNEIKSNILFEREFSAKSYKELVKSGPENIRRRMILGIFIQIFQQLTGINAIMYYAPQIFTNAGLTSNSSKLLATGVNGIVNVLATIPAILWIDHWGRRPTLTYIIFGSFCVIMAASIFIFYPETKGKSLEEMDHLFDSNPTQRPSTLEKGQVPDNGQDNGKSMGAGDLVTQQQDKVEEESTVADTREVTDAT
ncbi:6548_t:CDS:2 [Acaulospora colombiana]|uniref:6548_t:CDS:1 n=1 Tax=Acaulospora colombiana TaxID=27376 RepID=A0ACA9M3T1_9GLOM|nr:6548_t:CDS:2 [Acaulospora colombiana]